MPFVVPNLRDVKTLDELHARLSLLSAELSASDPASSVFKQLTFPTVAGEGHPSPVFVPNRFKKDLSTDGVRIGERTNALTPPMVYRLGPFPLARERPASCYPIRDGTLALARLPPARAGQHYRYAVKAEEHAVQVPLGLTLTLILTLTLALTLTLTLTLALTLTLTLTLAGA